MVRITRRDGAHRQRGEPTVDETVESLRELLTLDELTNRVGMSVRNVRFYTTKGLVPPPIRRGRSGYYTPDHVARLELVQELQSHGFTLAAIEKYVANIPRDATPEDIALQRAMLAPVAARGPDRDDPRRAGQAGRPQARRRRPGHPRCAGRRTPQQARPLPGGVSQLVHRPRPARPRLPDRGGAGRRRRVRRARPADRPGALRGVPDQGWPVYKESGTSPERVREVVERLKPLSISSLVQAYEAAMDETKREGIAQRAR